MEFSMTRNRRRHIFTDQRQQIFAGALGVARLTEEVEQRRHPVDVTYRTRNDFAIALTGQSNQQRNTRGFFKHYLFAEQMMIESSARVLAKTPFPTGSQRPMLSG